MQSKQNQQDEKKKRGTKVLPPGAWPNAEYYALVEAMKDFPTEEKKDDQEKQGEIRVTVPNAKSIES